VDPYQWLLLPFVVFAEQSLKAGFPSKHHTVFFILYAKKFTYLFAAIIFF
jgi:hypothetical protein